MGFVRMASVVISGALAVAACGGESTSGEPIPGSTGGGAPAAGGSSSGGTGGRGHTGGASATGGVSTGGTSTGGVSTGGVSTGGLHGVGVGGSTCNIVLPTAPTYSCKGRQRQPGDCTEYQMVSAQLLPPLTYPPGCEVTLPQINPFYPCALQNCVCSETLQPDGSGRGTWVCPM